jgi:phospholipase C
MTSAPPDRWGHRRVGAVLACAVISLAGLGIASFLAPMAPSCESTAPPPPAARSPVQHLFLIIKENHAFENYFGDLPGVLGYPPNGSFPLKAGNSNFSVAPFPLGFSSPLDLPHDHVSDLVDADGGRNDLFVAEAAAEGYPQPQDAVGYYTAQQIPAYYAYASAYRLADRFFTGVLGPTVPNRLFDIGLTHSSWLTDAAPPASAVSGRTVLEQLSAAGVSWRYLHSGPGNEVAPLLLPQIADDPCLAVDVQPFGTFDLPLTPGAAPNVTIIDTSNDLVYGEHPPGNVTLGEEWTVAVVNRIFESPIGSHSAVLIYYDENGGFWDPVTPPAEGPFGDGFRVPLLVLSPWSSGGAPIDQMLDPASILQFIDTNWGLQPLNERVAAADPLGPAFDFAGAARPPLILPTPVNLDNASYGSLIGGNPGSDAHARGPIPAGPNAARAGRPIESRGPSVPTVHRRPLGRVTGQARRRRRRPSSRSGRWPHGYHALRHRRRTVRRPVERTGENQHVGSLANPKIASGFASAALRPRSLREMWESR